MSHSCFQKILALEVFQKSPPEHWIGLEIFCVHLNPWCLDEDILGSSRRFLTWFLFDILFSQVVLLTWWAVFRDSFYYIMSVVALIAVSWIKFHLQCDLTFLIPNISNGHVCALLSQFIYDEKIVWWVGMFSGSSLHNQSMPLEWGLSFFLLLY